jgi:hypothetical protein
MSVRAAFAVAALGICGLFPPQAAAQLPPLPPAPLPPAPLPPAPLPIEPPTLLPPPPPATPLPPPPNLLPPPPTLVEPPPPPSLPQPPPPPAASVGSGSTPSGGSRAGSRSQPGGGSAAERTGSARPSGAAPAAVDGDLDAAPAGLGERARAASAREDAGGEAGPTSAERPPAAAAEPPPEEDGSLVGPIPNPFREAPPWLQPLMLAMLAVALVLLQLAALPAWTIPWPEAAVFVARRRPALLAAGAGLLGGLGVTVLALS